MEDISNNKYDHFYMNGNVITCYQGYDSSDKRFIQHSDPSKFVYHTLTYLEKESIVLQLEELISDYQEIITKLKSE